MIDEIFRDLGNQINSQLSVVSGLNMVVKLNNNKRVNYGRFASTNLDTFFNTYLATSGSSTSQVDFDQIKSIDFLDSGGNTIQSFPLDSSKGVVASIWLYLSDLYLRSDLSTSALNAYYQSLSTTQSGYQSSWITSYGRSDGEDTVRYLAYMTYVYIAAANATNLSLKNFVNSVLFNSSQSSEISGLVDILSVSDVPSREAIVNKASRYYINQEFDDFTSDEGRDLIQSRANNRMYDQSQALQTISTVESIGYQLDNQDNPPLIVGPSNSGGQTCQPQYSPTQLAAIESSISSSLRTYIDLDSPAGIASALALVSTAGLIGNQTLMTELVTDIGNLGTANDPILAYNTAANAYLTSLGLSISISSLQSQISQFFQNLVAGGVSKSVRLQMRINMKTWLDLPITENERDSYWSQLLTNSTSTVNLLNRTNLQNYINAVLYKNLNLSIRGSYTAELTTNTIGANQSRLLLINDLLVPTGQSLTASSVYLSLITNFLNADISNPGSTITTADVSEVISALNTVLAGNIVQEEINVQVQRIVSVMLKLSIQSSVTNFKEYCHALIGNFLFSADILALQEEQDRLFNLTTYYTRLTCVAQFLQNRQFTGSVQTDFSSDILTFFSSQTGNRLSRVQSIANGWMFGKDSESAVISAVTDYSYTLRRKSITPGSLTITVSDETYTDNGNGVMNISGNLSYGSVNYTTGDINLIFLNPVSANFTASYYWTPTNVELKLMEYELLYFFDELDTTSSISRFKVISDVESMTKYGVSSSTVTSTLASDITAVGTLPVLAPAATACVNLLYPLMSGWRTTAAVAAAQSAVYAATPVSLQSALNSIGTAYNSLVSSINAATLSRDVSNSALDTVYSVVSEFCDRLSALEDKASNALNNCTPKFRVNCTPSNEVIMYNVYSSSNAIYLASSYAVLGTPKFQMFGAHRALNKMVRYQFWDQLFRRSYCKLERVIPETNNGLNGILLEVPDIRLNAESLKTAIQNQFVSVNDSVAEILALVDFIQSLCNIIDGQAGNFYSQSGGVSTNTVNNDTKYAEMLAQANATLTSLLQSLSQLNAMNLGVPVAGGSVNFNFNLQANKALTPDVADWICNNPVTVVNPITKLGGVTGNYQPAVTLDTKPGCPSADLTSLPSVDPAVTLAQFYANGTVKFPPTL